MKKVISIVAFVVLILFTGLFLWKSFDSIKFIKDNYLMVEEFASSEEKSQWISYNNKAVNYSFQYPQGLEINEGDNGRSIYIRSVDNKVKIRVGIYFQEIFENKSVQINNYTEFKREVNRRIPIGFLEKRKLIGHEISFAGKKTIAINNIDSAGSKEIFIWQGSRVLQIEIAGKQDEVLISKIFSTFEFF